MTHWMAIASLVVAISGIALLLAISHLQPAMPATLEQIPTLKPQTKIIVIARVEAWKTYTHHSRITLFDKNQANAIISIQNPWQPARGVFTFEGIIENTGKKNQFRIIAVKKPDD